MTDVNALTRKKLLDKFDIAVHPTKLYASKDDVALAVKKFGKNIHKKVWFPRGVTEEEKEIIIGCIIEYHDDCFPVFKEEKKEELSKDDNN